jgi:TRAP-type C4-dicarboxylate transport system substrate-binding protein
MIPRTLSAALATVVLLTAAPARAQEPVVLRFAYTGPLQSPTYTRYWGPWVEKVNKEGEGQFKIEVFGGNTLATLLNVYDRLLNNVFQIGYGIQAVSGKFPASDVCTLPFLTDDAEPASAACWNVYANGAMAAEYADMHPIAIWAFNQATLHLNKPVQRVEDLKGLKIGLTAKPTGDAVALLGGTPIAMRIDEFYPSASRGVIDGIAIAWIGVMQFKVHEVTKYHVDAQLGGGTGFVGMNKAAYSALPATARRIFDRNSGLDVSRGFGKVVDSIQAQQRAAVAGMPGHTIIELSAAEKQRWRQMAQPVTDQWVRDTPNGEKLLAAFKAELAKAEATR